jgi:hypothetical protein
METVDSGQRNMDSVSTMNASIIRIDQRAVLMEAHEIEPKRNKGA